MNLGTRCTQSTHWLDVEGLILVHLHSKEIKAQEGTRNRYIW